MKPADQDKYDVSIAWIGWNSEAEMAFTTRRGLYTPGSYIIVTGNSSDISILFSNSIGVINVLIDTIFYHRGHIFASVYQ